METKEASGAVPLRHTGRALRRSSHENMGEAVAVLIKKLREEKRIRIIGDYDIDGVCASYLLLTA